MRLCLASDSHRHRHELLQAVKNSQPLDAVLHAGDETSDVEWLRERIDWPVWAVAGNWDRPTDLYPSDVTLSQFGPMIYLVHGHQFGVKDGLSKLGQQARAVGATIVVYGHTHRAQATFEAGILYINPGSLAQPRGRTEKTFALLDIEPDGDSSRFDVRVSHWTLQGESLANLMVRVELDGLDNGFS